VSLERLLACYAGAFSATRKHFECEKDRWSAQTFWPIQ